MCCQVALARWRCESFFRQSDYTIGYLTQEPDFDDQKTVLDTVLSSDLREMQLIRDYEYLMADYREERISTSWKIMSEMDSLNAWEIESQVKTVLSKLELKTWMPGSGALCQMGATGPVLLSHHDLLLLDEPTNHLDIDTIEWLTNYLKNSKKNRALSLPTIAISW